MPMTTDTARRELLQFLLQSPLVLSAGALLPLLPFAAEAHPELAIPGKAGDALDVFEIEAVARAKLPRPAWHFIVNGADDGRTVQANRDAFNPWQIRVRRLIDVSHVDMDLELFGDKLESPVFLSPTGNQQTIHPDGELATGRAAKSAGFLMLASTVSNASVGEIASVAGPLWFQLYRHRTAS